MEGDKKGKKFGGGIQLKLREKKYSKPWNGSSHVMECFHL